MLSLKANWPRSSIAKKRPSTPPTVHLMVPRSGSVARYVYRREVRFSFWRRAVADVLVVVMVGGSFTSVTMTVTSR